MRKLITNVTVVAATTLVLASLLAGCGDRQPASTFDPSNKNGPIPGPGGNGPGSNGPGGNGPSSGGNGPIPGAH